MLAASSAAASRDAQRPRHPRTDGRPVRFGRFNPEVRETYTIVLSVGLRRPFCASHGCAGPAVFVLPNDKRHRPSLLCHKQERDRDRAFNLQAHVLPIKAARPCCEPRFLGLSARKNSFT
jgi:hypothetical protein